MQRPDYSQLNDMDDSKIVNMVASQVAKAGNRAERRKILKALNKTKTIENYTQKELSKRANKEITDRANDSFAYIMAMFSIVLHDKYNWSDDDIEEMITEVNVRLNGEWSEGKSVEDVAKELFEKTGIELVIK